MRELTLEEKKRIAQEHFDHWFDRAKGSFKGYHSFFDMGDFNWAVFHLHQSQTEEDKDRFRLLHYAYIGARYDPKYRLSKTDMEVLEKPVEKLLELTEIACKRRIKDFVEE